MSRSIWQLCRLRTHALRPQLRPCLASTTAPSLRRCLTTQSARDIIPKLKKDENASRQPAKDEANKQKGGEKLKAYEKREQEERATAELPHVSVQEFTRLTGIGEATAEHARSCVYNVKLEMQNLPLSLSQRREQSAAHQLGGRVLHWLWNQPMSIRDELSMNRPFVHGLCYFLVAEEREDFVFRWLKLELENEKEHDKKILRHLWLSGIMMAQREWTDSVVLPLTTLEKALADFPRHHLQSLLFAATVAARKMIKSPKLPPYSSDLFDAVLKANRLSGPRHVTIWREAEMLTLHPAEPDARQLLQLVRTRESTVWNADQGGQNYFAIYLLRAAYISRLQGHAEDAAWLDSFTREKAPKVWAIRQLIQAEIELDPKLDKLRRENASDSKTPR